MDFVYLFRVLLKRKWIIIGSAIFAAAIAWYFTRNEPKKYRSTARVSTGFADVDVIKVNDDKTTLYDADIRFSNAINTWTSPSVISLLSYELILHDLKSPNPFRRLTSEQMQSPVYKTINKEEAAKVFEDKLNTMSVLTSYRPEEKKLLEFLKLYGYDYNSLIPGININQVQRTDYIQVDGISENPELSAFIVNNVFQEFIRYYRGIRDSKSQESVDSLKSIMDRKKQELDDKNKILRGEGNPDVTTENTSKFDLISDMEKSLSIEKNKQTDNYYELRKINGKLAALGGSTNSTTPNNNNEEMVLARTAMNNTYKEYLRTGDKNTLAKYNTLKSEYFVKYGNTSTPVTSPNRPTETKDDLLAKKADINVDIEASDAKIKDMERKISSLKGSASATASRGATVESLMEEIKLAEREYFDAKQKYNNAVDRTGSSLQNFRQLQIAQPAIEPEPSKRKMIVGMAGVAALSASILIIILLTYLDSSLKTPTIFSKTVNLKMISMVNFMKLKNKDLKDIITGVDHETTRLEKKRSNIFRESIRKLRYEIEKSGKQIFLFTSTKKGEGKTTLIKALSYSMSLSNKKILIIDTNFCNNDLTVQLDGEPILEKMSGLNDSSSTLAERVKTLSKDIGVGSVFIIGSEGGDYTPSEILPHENILKHLHLLTSEFDYIFLEGPPLNDFTDSRELLKYVDGVVAIFSATHIIKQIDKESISFFTELNGKFCGSVLNMVNLENVNTI